ncbi:P-selectin-like isoform X2 [Clavelina lepadiformis]|uniref:P-selectin-like isoform X2 n=1 Tax=Clavelina lepadiformis TaxID=159417 RepID=UPI0040421369
MNFSYVVLLVIRMSLTKGLKCWECDNVFTHEDCVKEGNLQICNANENSCQIELRHGGWGRKYMITKRCKQTKACQNNFEQNVGEAWLPMQCNLKPPSSVCRCCCQTDECNREGLNCWGIAHRCEPSHNIPRNGQMQCVDENKVGSICHFRCDKGFNLEGSDTSTCMPSETWDAKAPVCKPILRCLPSHTAPVNAEVQCTKHNLESSQCTFSCKPGYTLVGLRTSVCRDDNNGDSKGKWSSPAPVCEEIKCAPVQVDPANGRAICSDNERLGSRCDFSCDPNYAPIGNVSTLCVDNNGVGVWLQTPPVCQAIRCQPEYTNPENGSIECSKVNFLRSRCRFTCNEGFGLVGSPLTVCFDDGNDDITGIWSHRPATCQIITCFLPHTPPDNGHVTCTNGRFYGSMCKFHCNEGYDLLGDSECVCEDDPRGGAAGQWSGPAPICRRKVCPPGPGIPTNGRTVCSDDAFLGSICEFACDDLYRRVGSLYSKCAENAAYSVTWDSLVPVCERITCPNQLSLPHGEVICSDLDYPDSMCSFSCSDSYNLYPANTLSNVCQNSSQWDPATPCCARSCPPYAAMDIVVVLDSSSSLGADNWVKIKTFVRGFLSKFEVSPEASYIGAFRFNAVVDEDTQIFLNDFPDSRAAFTEAFDKIPYDGSGVRCSYFTASWKTGLKPSCSDRRQKRKHY